MLYKNTLIIDPLAYFPYEISEHILSFLPAKDLIRASAVSTLWYEFIGTSNNLMKKVKLKISCNMDKDFSRNILSTVVKSPRKYETLEIERCAQCMESIFDLLKSRQWKNIIITNTCFLNVEQALQFFSLIQENVKSLCLTAVYVRYAYPSGEKKGLMFPRLRSFVAKNTQAFLFPEVFQNIMQLKHFELFSNDQNIGSLKAVINFLKNNKNLQYLKISGRVFYQILYSNISLSVLFKLKKLSIANGNYNSGEFYKRVYKNFASLINQQADSLEIVSIDDWMGEDVLKAIYQLPKLTHLTIKGFTHIYDHINWSRFGLVKNTSIRKMNISVVPDDLFLLRAIIAATPNLTSLTISLMNLTFMDFIGRHSINLKKLSIDYLNVTHIHSKNLFKNLEHLEVKDYRSCLRENIMKKSFRKLNDFERMLFFIMNN